MADVTCPQCDGKKGPFTVFMNRGAAGCSVEERPCSRCKGAGTISEYDAKLYAEGQRVRAARAAADLSLHEASRFLGCSAPELSAIEHGREPAHHDVLIEQLRPKIDEVQLRMNGGPYCYHVEQGRYCGRAERWDGHGYFHDFKGAQSTGDKDA
jgi:hypothetical protein